MTKTKFPKRKSQNKLKKIKNNSTQKKENSKQIKNVLSFKKGTFDDVKTFDSEKFMEFYSITSELTLKQKIYLRLLRYI